MIEFEFLSAKNIEEAINYMHNYKPSKLLAGGTDLLVDIHKESPKLGEFSYVIDISNIEELRFIKEYEDIIEIGPLTTHTMLIESPIINKYFPLLAIAAKTIGSPQIRNRGTIGGNISNASPAADLVPPLMVLNADLELKSMDDKRFVPIEEFIVGPYKTSKKDDELITSIRIPKLDESYKSSFQKIGRRQALNIARLNLALIAKIDEANKKIEDIRIVPGSATPYPLRFKNLEREIEGKTWNQLDLDYLSQKIGEEMISITGERWSTPYKKPALGGIFKKAMNELWDF